MSDELAEFLGEERQDTEREESAKAGVVRDLLVFELDDRLFALHAGYVDSVVSWKGPAPVPGASSRVRGVIQDRGRIVVILTHPTGQVGTESTREPKRIVICTTPRGHLGLPATTTHTVGPLELPSEPAPATVYDSPLGPFMYLDPTKFPLD